MNDPNLFKVTKTELHYLPSCPCVACVQERARRDLDTAPTKHPLHTLTPEAAHLLGFINQLSPCSVARQIMEKQTN